jgi:hypothetical protein
VLLLFYAIPRLTTEKMDAAREEGIAAKAAAVPQAAVVE